MNETRTDPVFPTSAEVMFGLGLGGFFDGIVFHQLLQWHHMVSQWYPPVTLENLRINTLWDGIFHSATYVFIVIGLYLLWQTAHAGRLYWSSRMFWGTVLIGFGAFNLVEGLLSHQLLGIHHVNEVVARENWIYWDLGFLASGVVLAALGYALWRAGLRRRPGEHLFTAR